MTLPAERTKAVIKTRRFLQALSHASPDTVPVAIRLRAETLLRHFPEAIDMEFAHEKLPEWFGAPGPA